MSLPKLGARLRFVLEAPHPPPPPKWDVRWLHQPRSQAPFWQELEDWSPRRGVGGPPPWCFVGHNMRLERKWVTGDEGRERVVAREIPLTQLRHSRKETYSPVEMWVCSVDWIPFITRSSSVMRLAVFVREIFLVPRPPFVRGDTLQFAFCIPWSSALSVYSRVRLLTSQ